MCRSADRRTAAVMALMLIAAASAAVADPDACLLSIAEARELAGATIVESRADAGRCRYLTAAGGALLTVERMPLDSELAQAQLEKLGDASRFTSRQKQRTTIWMSRWDELDGWLRHGDLLLEVRAERGASPRGRRALERALVRIGERLE